MFESIRKHSKWFMLVLFLLVIPSFVLVGIDSSYFSGGSPVVARVDGADITRDEWDNAHRIEVDRLRAQQPGLDAKLLDSPVTRYATLERMVRDRVLQVAAQKMHLQTSDARLARSLQEIPQIASLRRADGTLDAEAYRALVGAQGLTPEGFEAMVRRDMAVNQVVGTVIGSSFASAAQVDAALDALFQRREVQIARFEPKDFATQVKVSGTDLEAYYKAQPALFQQPETANVEYVLLDLDVVRSGITLAEDDVRTYYQENLSRLAGKEERRASHILLNAPQSASSAEREKTKARAQELLAEVRKNPASFDAVARASSEDASSAAQGGDLGFFAPGSMVKPFEEAAFALNKGDISDVVQSDFGYHIIQLTDIKAPTQPSFETMRPELEKELQQQQAQRKFAEVAESFANTVYEQADSLKPVADKLKLKVQTANGITRTPASGATGPLANAKFLEALFSSDALENKRNTEAVEIGPSQMVAGRIVQYLPARTLPLAEVKDRVQQLYVAEKSAELARQEGQKRLDAWQANPSSATGLGAAVVVARNQPGEQPRAVVDAVLSTRIEALPAWVGVDLGAVGYTIAKVNRVVPAAASDAQQAAQRHQQYVQWLSSAEALAYYEILKDRYKVHIKVPRPSNNQEVAEN